MQINVQVSDSVIECSKEFTLPLNTFPPPSAYWKMDEVSGSRFDSVHGIALANNIGTTPSQPGKFVLSLEFGGASFNNDLITPYVPAMGYQANGVTVTCWVKLNNITTGASWYNLPWFIFRDSTGTNAFVNLRCGYRKALENPTNQNGFFSYWFQTGNIVASRSIASTTQQPLSLGSWHFVAYWYDVTDNRVRYQIDNGAVVVGTNPFVPVTPGVTGLTGQLETQGGSGTPGDYQIDEVGIWMDRILTPAELTQLYNGGNGLPYPFG